MPWSSPPSASKARATVDSGVLQMRRMRRSSWALIRSVSAGWANAAAQTSASSVGGPGKTTTGVVPGTITPGAVPAGDSTWAPAGTIACLVAPGRRRSTGTPRCAA